MPIPLIIAGAVVVVVVAALVYFFTSNDAAQNRTEYERKVQGVLDLLKEKLKRLKKRLDEVEATNNLLNEENKACKAECKKMNEEIERTQAEVRIMEDELARWKEIPSSLFGRASLIYSSPILTSAKYLPSLAIETLDLRSSELTNEIRLLPPFP